MTANKLALTRLEDRATPALFGLTWMNNDSVSVSFAPDGTDVAGVKSTLSATLDRTMPGGVWQTEVRRAFQAWTPATNVNFRFTIDDGAAFGSSAPLAGPLTRGDIRVSARPLSDNVLVITNPPDLVSDWAGEIVVNSNKTFSAGGAGGVDLYTAMLQEVGHALGVENSGDPSSAMYESYRGPRAGLAAGDVAAAQALYGVRGPDRFEGRKTNDSPSNAAPLAFVTDASKLSDDDRVSTPTVARADLHKAGDRDVYQFTTPSSFTGTTNLLMRVADASQLAGRLTVRDAAGNVVATKSATAPGQDVAVSVGGLQAGTRYYATVDAADPRFDVGSYRLSVGSVATWQMYFSVPASFVTAVGKLVTDDGVHDSLGTAVVLGKARPGTDARWDAYGTFTARADAARTVFQVNTTSSTPGVMLATVFSNQLVVARPRVTATDADGRPLAARVLRADGYAHVVQVEGVKPNKAYYLQVTESAPSWLSPTLAVGVDFRATPVALQTFADGTLTALQNDPSRALDVTRSQLVRFELSGLSLAGQPQAYATLTVRDAAGRAVLSIRADSGETVAKDVLLAAGRYTVTVSGATTDGSLLNRIQVTARLAALTDPIGPEALDADGSAVAGGGSPPTDPGYAWDPWVSEMFGYFWV